MKQASLDVEASLNKFISEPNPSNYLYLTCEDESYTFSRVVKFLISKGVAYSANFDHLSISVAGSNLYVVAPHMVGIYRGEEFDHVILEVDIIIK